MLKVIAKSNSTSLERVTLTPQMAMELLEHNTLNRPLSDGHVKRIAQQIIDGKWRFNGDTIKISDDGRILDGQHRLWACIEAKNPIDTVLVRGVHSDAFATIDTIRKSRNAGDTIALMGTPLHRQIIGAALGWLIRWQRNAIATYRQPQNKIENSDIEEAFAAHPAIVAAVERAMRLRRIGNPSVLAFVYYIASNKNADLAEEFVSVLADPAGVAQTHPLFQFRAYLVTFSAKRREAEHVIALAFKALNAAAEGRKMAALKWNNQGKNAEPFPELKI